MGRRFIFIHPQFKNFYSWEGDGSNEFMDLVDVNALSFTGGNFTIGGWMKVDTFTTSATLFSKGDLTTREYYLQYNSAGRIRGGCANAGDTAEIIKQSTSTYTGHAGAWHWIGMTVDNSNTSAGISLYLDGSAISASSDDYGSFAGMTNGTGTGKIGIFMNSIGNCMDGKIFHPFLLNKAASAGEMTAICNKRGEDLRGITTIASNIVFALRFTNGPSDFTQMTDYSGNGNHATMHNGESTDINTDIPS